MPTHPLRCPPAAVMMLMLAGAAGLGACGSSPELRVLGATVLEENERATVIAVSVDAANPGEEPVPLRDVEYALGVEGVGSVDVTRSGEATLGPGSTRRLVFPASLPGGTRVRGRSFTISGSQRYVLPGKGGEILTDLGYPLGSTGFSGSGVVGEGPAVANTPATFTKPREESEPKPAPTK